MQIPHARRHGKTAERRFTQLIRNVASHTVHRRDDLVERHQGFPICGKRGFRADYGVGHTHGISLLAGGFDKTADRIADQSENIGNRVTRRSKTDRRRAAEKLASADAAIADAVPTSA